MTKINNENKLNYYLDKYNISNFFDTDIKKYVELHFFKKGEHIYLSGEDLEYFYFLVSGKSKVYILMPNGKSYLLRFYNPVQILGDIEIIENSTIQCNIEAITDCYCIGINLNVIKNICMKDNKFLNYICKHLSYKLSTASLSSSINMLYPLENRLASYILSTYPDNVNDNIDSNLQPDNLVQIAELLGSSYRHLHRVIDKLSKENIIKKKNKSLVIIDKKKLKELAKDLYN